MKRCREQQEVFRDTRIISTILESQLVDVGECLLRAALSSKNARVSRGGWMLQKTCKFFSQHNLMRLLRETIFERMDEEYAKIEKAYEKWDCVGDGQFPWYLTDFCYRFPLEEPRGHTPFRYYRPVFVAWVRHRFPRPISNEQQNAIREAVIAKNQGDSWCGNGVLNTEENEHPELSLESHHVTFILARMRQISNRCDDVVVEPVLCFFPHDEILPVLLYYMATCFMGNYYTDKYNRWSLEGEIIDTAIINKRWGRARKFGRDRYCRTLAPQTVLYWTPA
jgi:hypothetical protein